MLATRIKKIKLAKGHFEIAFSMSSDAVRAFLTGLVASIRGFLAWSGGVLTTATPSTTRTMIQLAFTDAER